MICCVSNDVDLQNTRLPIHIGAIRSLDKVFHSDLSFYILIILQIIINFHTSSYKNFVGHNLTILGSTDFSYDEVYVLVH